MPGYPFVTVLPFALAADHCPWLLMSDLAEHCRNVRQDGRVSMLLQAATPDVLTAERMTVTGDLQEMVPDEATRRRLLRYCPEFDDYLALGDFHFFRLQPQRVRFIGGFGRMGWVEATEWSALPTLSHEQEHAVLDELSNAGVAAEVLGVDLFGVDCVQEGRRQRLDFAQPSSLPALYATASARLAMQP